MDSLRALLIQRAARLQEWPALTVPGWGTLRYPAFRNRVEGVALGLMAGHPSVGTPCHSHTGGPWDWVCEVACACCGLRWDPAGALVEPALLGGARFNDEDGRQPYHDRDHDLAGDLPFLGTLDQAEILRRLRRLNGSLGWDHTTTLTLPMAALASQDLRGALWSALYAGSHAILAPGPVQAWDPAPFRQLLS